jgi:hypothetical protein
LIAALVGAVPGTIALLDRPPETKVGISQTQGYIVAARRPFVQFTVRVVNESRHDVVLEDGTCRFRRELEGMEPLERSLRRRREFTDNNLFDYATAGAINGVRLRPSEGLRVACRFRMGRSTEGIIPEGYEIDPNASTPMTFRVATNDGRAWSWHGPVNLFNPSD